MPSKIGLHNRELQKRDKEEAVIIHHQHRIYSLNHADWNKGPASDISAYSYP